jgi:hypothetical protein
MDDATSALGANETFLNVADKRRIKDIWWSHGLTSWEGLLIIMWNKKKMNALSDDIEEVILQEIFPEGKLFPAVMDICMLLLLYGPYSTAANYEWIISKYEEGTPLESYQYLGNKQFFGRFMALMTNRGVDVHQDDQRCLY